MRPSAISRGCFSKRNDMFMMNEVGAAYRLRQGPLSLRSSRSGTKLMLPLRSHSLSADVAEVPYVIYMLHRLTEFGHLKRFIIGLRLNSFVLYGIL